MIKKKKNAMKVKKMHKISFIFNVFKLVEKLWDLLELTFPQNLSFKKQEIAFQKVS